MTMLLEALSILDKKNEFKCALIIKILVIIFIYFQGKYGNYKINYD